MNRALCMIAGGLLYSCASTAAGDASAADIPSWWEDPHKHDQSHLYFKAKGESFLSLEDARAEAFKSIKKQVAEYIQSSIEVRDRRIDVASRFELREVESFREFEPPHRTDQWIVFVLGRYPRTEYERIRGRLEQADRLVKEWAVAQSNVNREEFAQAESRLLGIISQYDLSLSPGFTLEDAKLALAGLYLKQGSVLKARTWIQDVRKSTTEPGWRSRAEDMERNLPEISLNDAFGSRKVALFCCASAGRDFRNSPEMQTEASAQLARAGVQAAMLTFQEPVATQIFNNGNADALLAKARDA
ncbi:MAG TPA: hypothetical protein PKM67_11470, partial [Kiritimatiellia bacterium]|nr:hypothetical protein [Kiritimatiellia bacterium]